jgi:hypothetical protein
MDSLFEYMHNALCQKGFEDFVHRFLQGDRCIKHFFTNKGQRTCPLGIKLAQWECLMKY